MPFARIYETFEVREMLRNAEGVASPITQAPAHSQTLHALATPGGKGTTHNSMLHRTHQSPGESKNQWKGRGGQPKTSAFGTLIHQAAAACDALNSPTGQAALAVLDTNATSIRLTITLPISREHGFLPASGAPSLTVSSSNSGSVDKSQNTSGVRLIIDRAGGIEKLHIQTCIPLGGAATLASWEAKNMSTNVLIANG